MIHDSTPAQRRDFDCRELFLSFTRSERRMIERENGAKARAIFAAASPSPVTVIDGFPIG
jgi:hypothetical protein